MSILLLSETPLFDLRSTIQGAGFACTEARSGLYALGMIERKEDVQLVIASQMLEDMSGHELYNIMRDDTQHNQLPFILLDDASSTPTRLGQNDLRVPISKRSASLLRLARKMLGAKGQQPMRPVNLDEFCDWLLNEPRSGQLMLSSQAETLDVYLLMNHVTRDRTNDTDSLTETETKLLRFFQRINRRDGNLLYRFTACLPEEPLSADCFGSPLDHVLFEAIRQNRIRPQTEESR